MNDEPNETGLPSTEAMLEDLSKVPGLDGFFNILALVAQVEKAYFGGPVVLTESETRIVQNELPDNDGSTA